MNLTESIRRYYEQLQPKYITWDFYEKYIDIEPPFGQLGLPVFLRTYSRHIESEKRREKWMECVLRNVEFSIGLDGVTSYDELKKEAQELFDYIFNLRTFPSGRALWTAGSKQTEADPSSIWNCTFRTIDSISSYGEIFYWLLIGAGCGYSVEKEYISQLPSFNNTNKTVKHVNTEHVDWVFGEDYTSVTFNDNYKKDLQDREYLVGEEHIYSGLILNYEERIKNVVIIVGDSKEGWVVAQRLYLFLLKLDNELVITFDYSRVRPAGVPLKRFGGVATGCKNFVRMIDQINFILKDHYGKINSEQAMDMVGITALCVVSGNIRRSATIALGDSDDNTFKNVKYDLWSDPEKEPYRQFRVMSNNSIVVDEKLELRELVEVFEKIKSNGEPGLYIRGNARKYDEGIIGTNPCVETGLLNQQSCNLTTNNVLAFVKCNENGEYYLDEPAWRKSLYLSTRIGSRVTTLPQWHPEWDKVQKSQRLLGVSMTGLMDAADALGWSEEEMEDFFHRSRLYVREVADEYHAKLGIERSARVSCVKPEGSVSQLPTVSSGVHRGYAPQFTRRVRFSSVDPLAKALLDVFGEDNVFPENGQGEYSQVITTEKITKKELPDWLIKLPSFGGLMPKFVVNYLINKYGKDVDETVEKVTYVKQPTSDLYGLDQNGNPVDTWVFSFPIKTQAKIRAIDESAISQLERYKLAQMSYTADGHNTSITVTVAPDEWDDVIIWVYQNWDCVIGVSFLPKYDPEKETYPQMPYEPCSVEKYEELKAITPSFTENELIALIAKYEDKYDEYEILEDACGGKGCPIR